MTKYYIYEDGTCRLVSMPNHSRTNTKETNKTNITEEEEVTRISLSRTKRNINEIIKCNNFKYFFTLTVSPETVRCDRFDYLGCRNYIRKVMKKIKRIQKDFIYLFIVEEHDKGGFHFHGVCSELPPKTYFLGDLWYTNKNGYPSNKLFDDLGFHSFSVIEDKTSVSYYIYKYISKGMYRLYGCHFYLCSKGLKRAVSGELPYFDLYNFDLPEYNCKSSKFDKKQFASFYKNDYCQCFDFNPSTLDYNQFKKIYFMLQEYN